MQRMEHFTIEYNLNNYLKIKVKIKSQDKCNENHHEYFQDFCKELNTVKQPVQNSDDFCFVILWWC